MIHCIVSLRSLYLTVTTVLSLMNMLDKLTPFDEQVENMELHVLLLE